MVAAYEEPFRVANLWPFDAVQHGMRDIRQAVLYLMHRPAYAAAIVVTIGLGIGANALVFSAVRAVLLRPLPFPDADRLVAVWETQPGLDTRSVAPANFLDWRGASSFDGLAAYSRRRRSLTADDPQRINVATVSANFFDVLRVETLIGRTFAATIPAGVTREVVIREDLWRRQFGADPFIVGRTLRLDDETLVVAGVIAAGAAFPEDVVAWTQAPYDIPELNGAPGDIRTTRDAWYFRVIGRVKPPFTRGEAQAELDAIAARLREEHPATNRSAGVNVVDLHSQVTGASAPMLWILSAVTGAVLLVACANVGMLLLAGALGRARELMIRAALGASRTRLVGQLTLESVLLALGGSAFGLGLAAIARPALIALLPDGTPRTQSIGIDASVAWFALALALVTAIAFGALPAWIASRADTFVGLRNGGRTAGSPAGTRMSSLLVVAQLATVLVLITGAGLMLRSLWILHQRDVGIDVDRLLAIDVTLPDARSRGRAAAVLDIQQMVDRLAALPGATAAAAVQTLPLSTRGPAANLRVEGRTFPPGEAPDVVWKPITPDYFRAVGARILRGRGFTDNDREGTQPVTVINAALARLLWRDADPIGARIGTGLDGSGAPLVVVGVVSDTPQEGISAEVLPEMYRPLAQPARFGVEAMSIVVRSDGDPASLASAARQAVREVHPQAPIGSIRTMNAVVQSGLSSELTAMRALAAFGVLAMLLAAVGLYGVMARLVGDRTRDLGIRLALGAEPRAVRWLVLRRVLVLCATGLATGGAASFVLARQLGSLLHGTSAADPLVFGTATTVLLAASLAASYVPARRASRIDPLIILKEQ
jgi:putative ABC transport system permease protein